MLLFMIFFSLINVSTPIHSFGTNFIAWNLQVQNLLLNGYQPIELSIEFKAPKDGAWFFYSLCTMFWFCTNINYHMFVWNVKEYKTQKLGQGSIYNMVFPNFYDMWYVDNMWIEHFLVTRVFVQHLNKETKTYYGGKKHKISIYNPCKYLCGL
jgi:hypothetical protein